ncbi:phage head-tail joining protein [Sulfitobacter sp. 1A12126]|uniref:phage head-tail joining protein n=1 Tax=Sulfitobacter sp. 1A12126 TaxID=3368591 RepID=UPI0037467A7A
MATVEQMEAQLDALEDMLASGVLKTEYEGKSLTYRSFNDLERAISRLEVKIARASGKKKPVAGFARFSRG